MRSSPTPCEGQRRGRGGDDLPHGDQVALAGEPSNGRATYVGSGPPARRGRPCSADRSRTGRAGGGRPRRRRHRPRLSGTSLDARLLTHGSAAYAGGRGAASAGRTAGGQTGRATAQTASRACTVVRHGPLGPPAPGEDLDDRHAPAGEGAGRGAARARAGPAAAVGDRELDPRRLEFPGDADLPSERGRACRTALATSSEMTTRASSIASTGVSLSPIHDLSSLTRHRDRRGREGKAHRDRRTPGLLDTWLPPATRQASEVQSIPGPGTAKHAAPVACVSGPGLAGGGPSRWSRASPGSSVMTASTPSDGRGRAPRRCSRPTRASGGRLAQPRRAGGSPATARCRGPAIQPGPSTLTAICQEYCRSMSSTTSRSGRQPLAPGSAPPREAHHPDRRVPAGPAELARAAPPAAARPARRSASGAWSRSPARPAGRSRATVSSSRRRVSTLPGLLVDLGRLVVEVGPRVLPGREVELVEVGELHRRDHAAAVA